MFSITSPISTATLWASFINYIGTRATHFLLVCGSMGLLWAMTGTASAQPAETPAIQPAPAELMFAPIGVVLLPVRDYTATPDILFTDSQNHTPASTPPQTWTTTVEGWISALLEQDARIHLRRDVRARLDKSRRYSGTKQVVDERYALARDLYKELRLEPALESLNLATKIAQDNFVDLEDPRTFADIQLLLALVLLEQGQSNLAHVAFKRMFTVDPKRRFQRGYYPEVVEAALVAAWTDLQQAATVSLLSELGAMETLLREVRARQVVTGALFIQDGVKVLRLVVYDGADRAFRVRDDLSVTHTDTDQLQVEAAVSRWLACLPKETVVVNKAGKFPGPANPKRSITLDSGLAHGIYLTRPTRDYFNSLGLVINFGWHAMPGLDVYAKMNLYSSIADPLRDLQDSLTSVRLILGSGLRFGNDRWQGELHPGIDIHYLGQFTVLTDPWCKFLGTDSDRCDTGAVTDTGATLQLGVNLGLGLRTYLSTNLYLAAQANFSLYLLKLQETNLNYLVGSELGLGYAF